MCAAYMRPNDGYIDPEILKVHAHPQPVMAIVCIIICLPSQPGETQLNVCVWVCVCMRERERDIFSKHCILLCQVFMNKLTKKCPMLNFWLNLDPGLHLPDPQIKDRIHRSRTGSTNQEPDSKIKNRIHRSRNGSTDQEPDPQIKNRIHGSRTGSTDQEPDPQIKNRIWIPVINICSST